MESIHNTAGEARRGNPAASAPAPTHDAAWFARKVAELRAELDALPPERRALAVEALGNDEERPNR